jgi:hypothetical protein
MTASSGQALDASDFRARVSGRFDLRRGGDGLDLGPLLGRELFRRPLAALVVGVGGDSEKLPFPVAHIRVALSLHRPPVHLEAPCERLDRRQEALLQPDDEQPRSGLGPARGGREALLARRAVLVEKA